jgi:hypothetical protein
MMVTFMAHQIYAKPIFVYHRLMMKDLEQMDRYLRAKIGESQKSEVDQVSHLVDATLTLFSRPNFDNMIEKLNPVLLAELNSTGLTQIVFEKFIDECLSGIRDASKEISSEAQITYIIALENWILEMKSRIQNEETRKLFEKIANSEVKISKLAKASANLHIPYNLVEPTDLAKKILKEYEAVHKGSKSEKELDLEKQLIRKKKNNRAN